GGAVFDNAGSRGGGAARLAGAVFGQDFDAGLDGVVDCFVFVVGICWVGIGGQHAPEPAGVGVPNRCQAGGRVDAGGQRGFGAGRVGEDHESCPQGVQGGPRVGLGAGGELSGDGAQRFIGVIGSGGFRVPETAGDRSGGPGAGHVVEHGALPGNQVGADAF